MQKGLTERLLCALCEGQFSKYENYAASVLRQLDAAPESSLGHIILYGADLRLLRLFGLSLLWRAHISKAYMFRAVKLGHHAERIRTMLVSGDAGEAHEYPFTFVKIVGLDTHGQMLIGPMRATVNGHRVYVAMARGYEWVFMVSKASPEIRETFPYVGSVPSLVIGTVAHDKRQLFSWLHKTLLDSRAG